jgi:hypothetical protein
MLAIPADPADGVAGLVLTGAVLMVKRPDHLRHPGRCRARSAHARCVVKRRGVGARPPVSRGCVGEILDAPVMRDVKHPPRTVIKRRRLRTGHIASKEAPILVERHL